jgi:predicted metal-dependent phosphotriesterase family hydrolase
MTPVRASLTNDTTEVYFETRGRKSARLVLAASGSARGVETTLNLTTESVGRMAKALADKLQTLLDK